ncbi:MULTISPECIES: hypothetical protein [Burkholderia]|uniref:hypothetical protein n=1 Tax=Burkholderia TaxID=32008 RepID=UPI000B2F2666|nr:MULTISPECIES: hypothetical protein [Burkholderia]
MINYVESGSVTTSFNSTGEIDMCNCSKASQANGVQSPAQDAASSPAIQQLVQAVMQAVQSAVQSLGTNNGATGAQTPVAG